MAHSSICLRLSAIESIAWFARTGARTQVEPTMNKNACARGFDPKITLWRVDRTAKIWGINQKVREKSCILKIYARN
jgi:hypothetical protein